MLRGTFSIEKARQLQQRLSKQIIKEDMLPSRLRYVAGIDVAYGDGWAYGAAAVIDYDSLAPVETKTARVRASFPYIPTLLSFREIRPALAAVKKLNTMPDLFLVDAQGIAHPFRLGFASHLGLLLDSPSIGVAKSRLYGYIEPENTEGWSPISDKGEVIGAALRRNDSERPIYVSIGHKVSLERAITIVRHCTKSTRIPEPIRRAHFLATEARKKHK